VPIAEARRLLDVFDQALSDVSTGALDPARAPEAPDRTSGRKSPILSPNIEELNYTEDRAAALWADGRTSNIPKALRSDVELLPHQHAGVAWLQALFEASEGYNCRGAVLADDMGLGKTLQLLILIAWALERNPK